MHEIDLNRLDLNLLVTFEVLMSEGSVTRAASRLGRTQSAVSHALARLRDQLGDPLLVKTGSGMTPSPFARDLIEQVRPILRSIQRIVAPPKPFDPLTSRRVFRLAIADFAPTLLPRVISEMQRAAPEVAVEWLAPTAQTMVAVADGQLDMAQRRLEGAKPVDASSDPGSRWFRTLVMEAYRELEEDVAWISSGRNLVKAQRSSPRYPAPKHQWTRR